MAAAVPTTHARVEVTSFSLEYPAGALAVVQAPVLTPGPGEALVKILVRPVNPADILSMMGVYAGWQPALPACPGLEGVGVVAALGPATPAPRPSLLDRLLCRGGAAPSVPAVGTRVIALPWPAAEGEGTFQEYVVVPVSTLVPVLDSISNEAAAQLIVNPVTVLGMLEELALPAGAWLLVTAASSALGTMMLKVCKKRGIRTVALVRRAALEAGARAAGADAVVVTGEGVDVPAAVRAATGGALCAAAVDAVAGEAQVGVTASVADGGTVLVYGVLGGATGTYGVGDLLFRGITLKGFWLNVYLGSLSAAAASALLAETQALVAEGALAPPPAFATRFSLARVGEAVAEANRPGRGGHKVLMCSEE